MNIHFENSLAYLSFSMVLFVLFLKNIFLKSYVRSIMWSSSKKSRGKHQEDQTTLRHELDPH